MSIGDDQQSYRGSGVLALLFAAGSLAGAVTFVVLVRIAAADCANPKYGYYVFPAISGILITVATLLAPFFRPSWVRFPMAVIAGGLVTFAVWVIGFLANMPGEGCWPKGPIF
jgi:hypothetical protein